MPTWLAAAAFARGPAPSAASRATPAEGRCATLERLPLAGLQRRGPVLGAAAERGERDAYAVPNAASSVHFVVRWGDDQPLAPAQANLLLDALELAWRVEVEGFEHVAPYGTDLYRFNVYVGDSGDGAPPSYGAGGYQTYDVEGWPMIVVARSSWVDPPFVEHTAVHEFYHAIQSETGRFPYRGLSAWYWEATAEWAASQAAPDNPALGTFAPGYTWLPELGVEAFDYPDRGTLEELHQYGAFLFPYDLAAAVGPEVVTGTWKDPGTERDPMELMRRTVSRAGGDFDALWLDHVAHTVLLDHPLAPVLAPHYEALRAIYPGESPVTRDGFGEGGAGRLTGEEAPRRHGAAVLALRLPEDGPVRVEIDGDDEGTDGSPASWLGRVIVDGDEAPTYLPLPFDGGHAALEVEAQGHDVYVVVAADTPSSAAWDRERFRFDWSLTSEPDRPPPRPRPEPARGCAHAPPVPAAALLLVLLPTLRRRRAG